jgi:hypothetical protein
MQGLEGALGGVEEFCFAGQPPGGWEIVMGADAVVGDDAEIGDILVGGGGLPATVAGDIAIGMEPKKTDVEVLAREVCEEVV